MLEYKLMKSFTLLEGVGNSKKGETFTVCTNQGTIPLVHDDIRFRSASGLDTLTLGWFLENKFIKAKPCEFFSNMEEKFNHIT